MRLSAIIPTLNEARALPGLLAALREEVDEVVVADGGSTDGTDFGGAVVVRSERGRGRQLNAGARAATGDVFWFLHADSGVPAGAGAAIRASTAEWGCFRVKVDSPALPLRSTGRMMTLRARLTGSCTGDMGIWARRSLFEAVGGFPDWPLCEDLAWTDRARRLARAEVLAPRLRTSARRWEKHGVVSTMLRMWMVRAGYRLGQDPASLVRWYT